MLDLDPNKRLTASQVLAHPWIQQRLQLPGYHLAMQVIFVPLFFFTRLMEQLHHLSCLYVIQALSLTLAIIRRLLVIVKLGL